jgi:diacylglycerol kinase (ATP)
VASPPELPPDPRALRSNDRVVLLVNPAARSTGDRSSIATATRTLARRYRVEVVSPSSADGIEAAARAAAASSDAVIVAGGDGTLHRVINAIGGPGASNSAAAGRHQACCATNAPLGQLSVLPGLPIGLLPLGTGNDFAGALALPADTVRAAARIVDGRTRQIDLVCVNQRLFCTVGVLGLAAEATLAFDRLLRPGSWSRPLMRALGGWSYRIAGLNALFSRGSRLERVEVDAVTAESIASPGGEDGPPMTGDGAVSGEKRALELWSTFGAFITNTTRLGGGMDVPITSDMADGQLEIASIAPMSRMRLLWAFTCLANGWRVPDGALRVVRTTRAVITCERRLPFAADGELVCEDRRFEVAVRPGALRVIC